MKQLLTIIAAALAISSCGGNQHKADDPLGDSGRTLRTEHLLANLVAMGDSGVYLFGHQDATVCGIGWEADYASDSTVHQRSDVKSVCNDFPALLAFDLSGVERGSERNLDSVPFERIRQEIIAHYDRGGMVSLSWTVNGGGDGGNGGNDGNGGGADGGDGGNDGNGGNDGDTKLATGGADAVADFLKALETPYGVRVPVVLRLRGDFTADDWRAVARRLKEKGVVNALYAYAPAVAGDVDEAAYMARYPGDDVIDILGLDYYCHAPEGDTTAVAAYAATLGRNLQTVCAIAKARHKAAALTETGYDGLPSDNWWTQTLAPVLERSAVSYVLVWRNGHSSGDEGSGSGGSAAAYREQGGSSGSSGEGGDSSGGSAAAYREQGDSSGDSGGSAAAYREQGDSGGEGGSEGDSGGEPEGGRRQFFAPYPGQRSVSDFVRFYNRKATLFLRDVNGLYLQK